MTEFVAPAVPAPVPSPAALRWLASKDTDFLVTKRSVRAAVVMPSAFAVAHVVSSNGQVGLFAAFGSFALLLMVDFTGALRERAASYIGLYAVSSGFIALGTVASTHEVAAVVSMAFVGFAVLYAGIVSPVAATATTAALLTFVLPVAVAEPAAQVGPRLVGWTLAAALCIPACLLVWPTPWHDNLRRRVAMAVSSVARLADDRALGKNDPGAIEAVEAELTQLRAQFSATPYPPTGAASGAVAVSKLVGRVEWVAGNTAMLGDQHWTAEPPAALAVTRQVAETLHQAAVLICDENAHPVDDPAPIRELQESTRRLQRLIGDEVQDDISKKTQPVPAASPASRDRPGTADDAVSATDPGFHARALGIAAEMVADAALEAAGSEGLLDQRMDTLGQNSRAHLHRILSHVSFRSVWFRNAVRGAIGLAIAVAVVEVTDVQHGFWVVLGTLSVLRSNALGTGATALRAVVGTALGVVVGSAIMVGVADHSVLLWVLLPLAVFIAGMAPSMIGFATGQAAFTLTVIILFNIIAPVGWKVGLTRIEDVAIGCAVSVVVGLLFWPRGATAALGRALAAAFVASSAYVGDAVERLTMTSSVIDTRRGSMAAHRAYLLLDDAFRQFVAERGAKVVSVETVARLFMGSNRLRLAGYTLESLPVQPPDPGQPEVESVAVAEAVLRDSYGSNHRWYQEFAELLTDQRQTMDPLPTRSDVLHRTMQDAIDDVRSQQRDDRLQTTRQMLWADELLENQSQMQADLLASADLFLRGKRRSVLI